MRRPRDYYQTPIGLVVAWAKSVKAMVSDRWGKLPYQVVDLGAGDGRIGREISDHAWMLDVRPQADDVEEMDVLSGLWLDEVPHDKPLVIVSNPPFSLAVDFLFQAHVARNLVGLGASFASFLLPLSFLGSQKRREMWETVGMPDRIDVLVPRPSFTSNGDTAHEEYGLFWWGVGHSEITRLEWK